MLAKLYSIRPAAWGILALLVALAVASVLVRSAGFVSPQVFMYAVQPAAALAIAGVAYGVARHRRPVAGRATDRAFLVGGVLAIWFVLYFASGLVSTYVHNSLFTGAKGVVVNLWQFGVVAAAIEYARFSLLKLVGRRNVLWFGFILSCVLAVQQVNFARLQNANGLEGLIQLGVADFVPAIFSSFVLTYLAITSGLAAQLVYRLGLVAIVVLPPIIPNFDWYMQGISFMLLAVAVYVVADRSTRADLQHPHRRRSRRPALDVLWIIGMVALVCFMTGIFKYRPYVISTNSMVPTYSRGAMVVVQDVRSPIDIKVGDIVQYKTTSITVTHRVIAIDVTTDGSGERVFTVQGDNNPSPDALVAQNQIVGVVRAHVPYLGYPTVWLTEIVKGGR